MERRRLTRANGRVSAHMRFIYQSQPLSPLKRAILSRSIPPRQGITLQRSRVTYDRRLPRSSKPAQGLRCMQYCVTPSDRFERRVRQVTLCPAKGTASIEEVQVESRVASRVTTNWPAMCSAFCRRYEGDVCGKDARSRGMSRIRSTADSSGRLNIATKLTCYTRYLRECRRAVATDAARYSVCYSGSTPGDERATWRRNRDRLYCDARSSWLRAAGRQFRVLAHARACAIIISSSSRGTLTAV